MAPVVPNPTKIRAFKSEAAFEAWQKGSGKATVTIAQALDVVLCWGWIDADGRWDAAP